MKKLIFILIMISSNVFAKLPNGFVYTKDIDPSIIEVMSYATSKNFTARKVRGYGAKRAISTKEAAIALSKAQKDFMQDGYSIVIYDAYRPQKAVDHFIKWSRNLLDQKNKDLYYPYVNKAKLFELGYIAKQSGHSKGSTFDISLIKLGNKPLLYPRKQKRILNKKNIPYLYDGSEDFGTHFDYFGKESHHGNTEITKKQQEMRLYLKKIMEKHGFVPYEKEWWHYTLKKEPFDKAFDFNVQ